MPKPSRPFRDKRLRALDRHFRKILRDYDGAFRKLKDHE